MPCLEGERLKSEVLSKVEEYLQAEEAQQQSLEQYGDVSLMMTEHAYEALSEARRRYWTHVKQHHCEAQSSLPAQVESSLRLAV